MTAPPPNQSDRAAPPASAQRRLWPDDIRRSRLSAAIAAAARAITRLTAPLTTPVTALRSHPGLVTIPEGITYKPLARTTLDRALAPEGPGSLDYAVTFPLTTDYPRRHIRIRATQSRYFHDLAQNTTTTTTTNNNSDPDSLLAQAAAQAIRPGARVLILGAGTGYIAATLAEHVGPAGAVTAFEADAQSVAFARARYPAPNAAHERLSKHPLPPEPAGAAEAVLVAHRAPDQKPQDLWACLPTVGTLILQGKHTALAEALAALPDAQPDAQSDAQSDAQTHQRPDPQARSRQINESRITRVDKRPPGVASTT
ncbi:MAG: hypothetical protein AAFR96_07940 [Planctomycetota bacterium]